jgi:hypothetical protein
LDISENDPPQSDVLVNTKRETSLKPMPKETPLKSNPKQQPSMPIEPLEEAPRILQSSLSILSQSMSSSSSLPSASSLSSSSTSVTSSTAPSVFAHQLPSPVPLAQSISSSPLMTSANESTPISTPPRKRKSDWLNTLEGKDLSLSPPYLSLFPLVSFRSFVF